MQAIVFGGEKPAYADMDVTLFDMTGISESNKDLCYAERRRVLRETINPAIWADYYAWVPSIRQMRRIKQYPWAYRIVCVLDRVLFKIEKCKDKKVNG